MSHQPPPPPPPPSSSGPPPGPLPSGVTWDEGTRTLTARASADAAALTTGIVWGVRILALLVGFVILVGGALLGDGPPWWVLAVVAAAWGVTVALRRGQDAQDAAWQLRISPAGIAWQDRDRPRDEVAWVDVAALQPASRWVQNPGGPRFESRWLEVVQHDGTVHRLPGVMSADRYPQLIDAARARHLVPAGVRIEPGVRR